MNFAEKRRKKTEVVAWNGQGLGLVSMTDISASNFVECGRHGHSWVGQLRRGKWCTLKPHSEPNAIVS